MRALPALLFHVQEVERRSIARELHDEIGQALTGIKLSLEMAADTTSEGITVNLREVHQSIGDLMEMVRNLSLDLRPSMLDDLGLLEALLWHFKRFKSRTNIDLIFKHSGLNRRFDPEIETAAYRIVQEAMTNIVRHASTVKAEVVIFVKNDLLCVQVNDAGNGFNVDAALSSKNTLGIAGMYERVALLGGNLTIESVPETGTKIFAEIPLNDSLSILDRSKIQV